MATLHQCEGLPGGLRMLLHARHGLVMLHMQIHEI